MANLPYRPSHLLDRGGTQKGPRLPVTLAGKVWCRVDIDLGANGVGDPPSSSTSGSALRADDLSRAFEAVLGRALGRLTSGWGLVPILVLQ